MIQNEIPLAKTFLTDSAELWLKVAEIACRDLAKKFGLEKKVAKLQEHIAYNF